MVLRKFNQQKITGKLILQASLLIMYLPIDFFYCVISLYFIHQSPIYVFHFLLIYISLFGHFYMNGRATPVKSPPEFFSFLVKTRNQIIFT